MMYELLKELSDAPGISSREESIANIMKNHMLACGAEVFQDGLGSAIGYRMGNQDGVRILIAGHMDEVGFMVKEIDEKGYLKLNPIGSLWTHLLLDHSFYVMTSDGKAIEGVIGSIAQHGISQEVRNRTLPLDSLYLDLGVFSRQEVLDLGIQIGDQVVPCTKLHHLNSETVVVGKALDNRLGCTAAIEVLRRLKDEKIDAHYYAVGNVQEEPGLRGARTSTDMISPDIGFAVDTTIAGDTPLNQNSVKMGKGVVISLIDSNTIAHRGLIRYVEETCKKNHIPYQYAVFAGGGTDAGNIHKTHAGVISMCLSIPVRYMHASQTIADLRDLQACVDLLTCIVREMTRKQFEEILDGGY